ncbi:hypothetical protein Tco_0210698 [Tanacetum coccineum]
MSTPKAFAKVFILTCVLMTMMTRSYSIPLSLSLLFKFFWSIALSTTLFYYGTRDSLIIGNEEHSSPLFEMCVSDDVIRQCRRLTIKITHCSVLAHRQAGTVVENHNHGENHFHIARTRVSHTEAPPSPDYVPGPEELEQAPPSPDYVPGPEHTDDEIVAEDQPGAEDASPAAQSPDYVPESDPEADLEEDDDEDPEEDPADGGDDGDDEDGSFKDARMMMLTWRLMGMRRRRST